MGRQEVAPASQVNWSVCDRQSSPFSHGPIKGSKRKQHFDAFQDISSIRGTPNTILTNRSICIHFCFYNLFHSPTFDSLLKGMERAPSPNLCRNKEMRVLGVFSTGLNPSIQLGVCYWDSGQEDHRYPFAGEENPKVGVF